MLEITDYKNIKINTGLAVPERMKSFAVQAGSPYLFRVEDTVVEVEYTGKRSFSAAITNLLSREYSH